MNRKIIKAVRAGNEFKADWLRAQRWKRCPYYMQREIGLEEEQELLSKCQISRKVGY